MFMDGFMLNFLDSLFRKMLFGEISKRTVRIFGGVLIFPGFVCLIVLLVQNALELILT